MIAMLSAHLPSQDSSRALVNIPWTSRTGKVSYIVARKRIALRPLLDHNVGSGEFAYLPQLDFDEAVIIGYNYIDANGQGKIRVRVRDLVHEVHVTATLMSRISVYSTNPIASSDLERFNDPTALVTTKELNIGVVYTAEVSQLYVSILGGDQTDRQLQRFKTDHIEAGSPVIVRALLTRRGLSV